MNELYLAYADGACVPNPGRMGVGAVLLAPNGEEVEAVSLSLGFGTNNEAEYHAAISAAQLALSQTVRYLELRADSKLVIEQAKGNWLVREDRLVPLHAKLSRILHRFERVVLTHVPRQENRRADALASLAAARKLT